MQNKKLVVSLALVLIALGGLASWDEWQTKKDQAAEKTKNRVAGFRFEDLTGIEYASSGATAAEPKADAVALTLSRQGEAWRIKTPIDVPADAVVIKNFVSTVTDYAYSQVVAEAKDKWAEYGLAQPGRTITFNIGGEKPDTFTIYVGNKAPVGYSVYFRTSRDEKVYAGSQHLLMSTSKSLADFRDKSFVKADETVVKTLSYARKSQPTIELAKADGGWKILQPEPLEAEGSELREFFGAISQLRAEGFIDQPTADDIAAFQTPDYQISWTDDAGQTTTLKVLEKAPQQLHAALAPDQRIFILGEDARAKLKRDLLNFRNRRVMAFDSVQISKIEIDGDTYQNVGGMWYMPEDLEGDKPKDKVKERAHVRAFVVDLEFARADEFLAPTDPKLEALAPAPEHRIKLTFKDPAKSPEVVIDTFAAPGEADKIYIKRSGHDRVFRVAKSVLNGMKPGTAPAPTADEGALPELGGQDLPLDGLPLEDSPDEELPAGDLSQSENKDNKG